MIKFRSATAALLIGASIAGLIFSAPNVAAQAVTEAQNGKTVVVDKGASLVITLESNPSTGYDWQVARNDAAILKLSGAPMFRPAAHEMPGAPGRQSFMFHAISLGQDTIVLEYRRPWEKGIAPAKTFSISVTVK